MFTNYKTWCRLCGDLSSQEIDDENILDIAQKITDLIFPSYINVCASCQSQLTQIDSFIKHAKQANEMFQGLDDEDENELCVRRLNAYRTHFKMATLIDPEQEQQLEDTEMDEIVEEILVETTNESTELLEVIEEVVDEDEKTFMYHMTESNKLLKLFDFKCHLCPQPAYENMRMLTEHCRVVHDAQPSVKCCSDECGKMLQTWRRLVIHKEKHFPSAEALTCDICHSVFATRSRYESHKLKNHQHMCSYCAKPFSQQKTLKFHESTHLAPVEDRKSFQCPDCSRKFITKQACQNHVSMKHEKVITVTCPVAGCAKGFFTRKAMLEHQRTHREKTLKCPECDFMGKTKSQLNAHMERHFKDAAGRKLECLSCGLKFETLKDWKKHADTHEADKVHSCCKCDVKFTAIEDLSDHMNVHSEV